jgi:hypothetical protein
MSPTTAKAMSRREMVNPKDIPTSFSQIGQFCKANQFREFSNSEDSMGSPYKPGLDCGWQKERRSNYGDLRSPEPLLNLIRNIKSEGYNGVASPQN